MFGCDMVRLRFEPPPVTFLAVGFVGCAVLIGRFGGCGCGWGCLIDGDGVVVSVGGFGFAAVGGLYEKMPVTLSRTFVEPSCMYGV